MADESGLPTSTEIPSDKESISGASPNNHTSNETKQHHQEANSKTDEENGASSTDAHALPEVRTIRGFKWVLCCVALFSANFLYGLDTTIAADIQAAVAQTFDDISRLGWLGIGFTLGSVALILPLGKAYAIFDTK